MSKLILLRHGESIWNKENRFTGWVDIGLSEKGKQEAITAGKKLENYFFDKIYVSHLIRAVQTLNLILENIKDKRTAVIKHEDDKEIKSKESYKEKNELIIYQTKALAERHYGKLQGLNKEETAKKYGKEKVHLWRRSYKIKPPGGESLEDTLKRVIPYWNKKIKKDLINNKTILIVAHGNSLRAIVKYLEKISEKDIPNYEIPTGIPIEYTFDSKLKIISKKQL
ncbi:MAG: 2,3-bisphosphoglycerate-dependent phosphoglycerate mutase [Candidatus Woesearchaeota archaeon]